MKQVRRTAVGGVAVLGLTAGLLAAGVTSATAAEPVDSATLEEVDKPGTTMISAAPFDVSAYGYTEREFFASGEAHRFQNADGSVFAWSPRESMTTAIRGDIAGDYKTRVVVRQPSAEKFNGTLVVELTNVTTGNDGEFTFAESYDTLLTEGYAVAVVSGKKVGVDNIVATRPARYGDLEVEPEDCAAGACPVDTMSIDIFTQISKALKDSPDSPFAEIGGVDEVIAVGQSGSASNLSAYYNKIQPFYNFFDGFVFWDGAGPLRTDVATPGVALSSWTWNTGGAVPVTGEYTREWEVNGAAHGSAYVHEYFDEVFVRDGTQPGGASFTDWHLGIGNCASRQVGTKVHVGQVIGAAIDNVDTWIRGGESAAPDATFQRNPDGSLALDDNGRVIGGVQIADAAAPSWRYEYNTGGWTCPAAGAWAEYTAEELNEMYGSHAGYVAAVTEATEAALARRHILASDAAKTIAEAKASTIGAAVSDDSQEIEVSIPQAAPGEFVWSIDGSNGLVQLGDAVESGDHYAAAGEINPVRVTDTRAGSPVWSVSASVSDFAAGDDTFSGKYLGWTPKVIESGTRVQAGAAVGSGFDGGKGLSVSSTLGFGQTGHDRASALLGADLGLKIPLEVGEGTYAATLTLTALS
ncbi:hypothetical protein GCM10022382_14990 [Microbacterium invictum]